MFGQLYIYKRRRTSTFIIGKIIIQMDSHLF